MTNLVELLIICIYPLEMIKKNDNNSNFVTLISWLVKKWFLCKYKKLRKQIKENIIEYLSQKSFFFPRFTFVTFSLHSFRTNVIKNFLSKLFDLLIQ